MPFKNETTEHKRTRWRNEARLRRERHDVRSSKRVACPRCGFKYLPRFNNTVTPHKCRAM